MAQKGPRIVTWLLCKECNRQNYATERNKTNTAKLELKKHCPQCKKHTNHKSKDKLK